MLYKDLCGCEKTTVSRENTMQQPGNSMQPPVENIVIPEENTQCPTERWSNRNTNRPSDKWPNWENNCPDKENTTCPENNMQCPNDNMTHNELLNKIRETIFAIVDLNLFLDTHPNCKEALELFNALSFTLESLKREYTAKYGPLKAVDSSNNTPFEWVSNKYLWPWQRKKEE